MVSKNRKKMPVTKRLDKIEEVVEDLEESMPEGTIVTKKDLRIGMAVPMFGLLSIGACVGLAFLARACSNACQASGCQVLTGLAVVGTGLFGIAGVIGIVIGLVTLFED